MTWVTSVIIGSMIHLAHVYGAAVIPPGSDGQAMETDGTAPADSHEKHQMLRDRAGADGATRRGTGEGTSTPVKATRKRKRVDLNSPQGERLMFEFEPDSPPGSSMKDGGCGAFQRAATEVSEGQNIHTATCTLPFTTSSSLTYVTKFVEGTAGTLQYLTVTCDGSDYIINNEHIIGVSKGSNFEATLRADPMRDFNTRAFNMPCLTVFYDLQRNLLSSQLPTDVLEKDICEQLSKSICLQYKDSLRKPQEMLMDTD
ncbi:hypothetical protein FOZ62_029029 [Perkinsus olseni]|uniref:Salivary lipocalin n=2 Tax=Perkinsus olseni TaxID=32597 RepID=A0A7J6RNE6_PEROL|nr:hypothetical protein FOZ62_029029 [Perkinsus olseni]